jgi:superfamily II DNA or RNA helicase
MRAAGYFSSSAFEAIGLPLLSYVIKGGTMKLVTSVCLEEEDVLAIEKGLDSRRVCEGRILEQVNAEFGDTLGRGAYLLTALLEAGRLEIRIAIPKSGRGIYHEKVGVFLDDEGNHVSFSGSSNESRSGLEINYECVDVYTSWEALKRALAKRKHFELLWEGNAPGAVTFEFPEAAKRELIRRYSATSPPPELADLMPRLPSATSLWKHQEMAVAEFLKCPRGVLEMATGTGKTRTALHICRKLLEDGKIDTIVVSADGNDLLDQWYGQLLELTKTMPERHTVLRHYHNNRERDYFLLNKQRTFLLASRQALAPALTDLSREEAARTLLIHDEVHRLGSPGNRESLSGLSRHIQYRLGLSATPEREYDKEGNDFIAEHIGPVLMRFGLDDAIRRGILTPFNYHPIEYVPDENDRERLKQVYRRAAARREAGTPMSEEEMWIELAKVHKTSEAKPPLFDRFIAEHQELLRRCIIFVETREYGDKVLSIVHKYRHDFHTYYADADSETLRRFAGGEIECLLTCHRLSEGIDIHSIGTVILFSSARARLETIQRIGRCLRVNPRDPQKRANVVDFIRVAGEQGGDGNNNPDEERREWLSGLSRVIYEGQEA